MSKVKVIIYSKENCPYCVRAKQFFASRNIAFEEIDLSGQFDEMQNLKNRTGHMTMPQIFVDEKFVGGYSDLVEKYAQGEFKDLF